MKQEIRMLYIMRGEFLILVVLGVLLSHKFAKLINSSKNGSRKLRKSMSVMFACSALAFFVALLKTFPFYSHQAMGSVLIGAIMLVGLSYFYVEVS